MKTYIKKNYKFLSPFIQDVKANIFPYALVLLSFLNYSDLYSQNNQSLTKDEKVEILKIFNGLFINYQTDESLRKIFGDFFEILVLEEYKEFEDSDSILLIGKKK
ncbi:hypothetical protein OO013_07860 [Mangrovivirga sp. M17]|uniref:Uncharacterized protein n=1 Tax=Mangrovivirga halotolerans TaxID=2993936 RepID=A0ABT3RQ85_9BACT|nr:hypothetical protein [Mangrovivirga halotolerans]MCX2743775.1 hypothetical protein [Mangrovivirga halotolerans]